MAGLEAQFCAFWGHSSAIATFNQVNIVNKKNFELLSGRIEGLAEALLRVTAALEMQGVIDGPQISDAWRAAVGPHTVDTELRHTARTTLHELADALEAARNSRQALKN